MDNRFHRLPIAFSLLLLKLGAFESPPHTPAAAAGTTLTKECLKIRPTVSGERVKLQLY
jgi:hypothetical protein